MGEWPQRLASALNLPFLYVNILEHLTFAKHFTVLKQGQSACLGLRKDALGARSRGLSLCTGPEALAAGSHWQARKEESPAGALQREAGPAVRMNRTTPCHTPV